jgi:glycosyltransferase involved in cell wall biosynthesis
VTVPAQDDESPRTRLLIICTTLSRGGAERDASNIANLLDRQLFKVDIALMRVIVDYPVAEDVTIHDLGKQHMLDNLRAIWRIRRLAKSGSYDMLLSSLSTTNYLTLLATFTLNKFPFWIAQIDIDPLQLGITEPEFVKRIVKKVLQYLVFHRASALLTNSFGSRDGTLQLAPGCREKLQVIYNSVNLEMITRLSLDSPVYSNTRPGSISLISVARLEPEKGIAMALHAVAGLVRSGLDLFFVVCGSGSQGDELKKLAGDLGIGERVVFAGFLQNPYAEMVNADIFVLASESEGLPNALIEAQVLGIPAVATNCLSGPSELIEHGRTGQLVPVGDQTAMAAAIRELATDPELRMRYGKAAAEQARAMFEQEKQLAKMHEYLASLT